jgi:hypothetical protein
MTTTTREAALEAALKLARNRLQACAIDYPTGSREMAERSEWADEATAALSTPATEPQGYMEGLGLKRIVEEIDGAMKHGTWRDEHGMRLKDTPEWVAFYNALAARPAPQPAADTRVVTVAQLERWRQISGSTFNALPVAQEIRAIIGTAPSDKIAEAARDKTAAELVIDAYDAANLFREADMHPALCHCNRCAIDWMRALAGKGETP